MVLVLLQSDTADLKELARIANRDPRYFYRGIDPSNLELSGQDIEGIEFSADDSELKQEMSRFSIEDVLEKGKKIGQIKRSEERVVLLMLLIFENPKLAHAVLSSISEKRSKSAAAAIAELRLQMQKHYYETEPIDRVLLVRAVRRHYAHTFPDSRAALFYYFVMYLSEFSDVKDYLRKSWAKSHSYAFDRYQEEINVRLHQSVR